MRGKPSVLGKIKRFFDRIADTVYRALARGPVGRFFAAYPVSDRIFRASGTAKLSRLGRRGRNGRPLRRGMAQAMDQSFLRKVGYRLLDNICRCSLRSVGAFLSTTGIYAALITWLIASVWQGVLPDALPLFCGLAFTLAGAVLLFSEHSLGYALSRGALLSFVMRELFGFSEDALKDVPKEGLREYAFVVPFGMLMGTAIAVFGPVPVLLVALALLFFFTVFVTPEAGVLLLVLFTPYAGFVSYGELVLGLGIFTVALGYFCKLLRGTRSFHLEILDFAVLALLIFTLFTGVFAIDGQGRTDALISALVLSLYFPVVNILATPHWLYRFRLSLLVSATISSLVGIMQFIVGAVVKVQAGVVVTATDLGRAVTAGFADNTVFAYFMVISFPFALHAFLCARPKHRMAAGFTCVSVLAASVLCFVQSAWLSILVEIVVLLFICVKYASPYLVLGLGAIPGVVALLPVAWREALQTFFLRSGDLSATRMALAGDVAKRLFFENGEGFFSLWSGLSRLVFGLGSGGLTAVAALYTALPADRVQDSFNFWLYRLCEGGILGLLLPICLLFLLLQNCFSLLGTVRDARGPIQPVVGVGMVVGVVTSAFFQYTWNDPCVLLLFFLCVAFLSADARYRRLQEPTDTVGANSDSFAEVEYQFKRKKDTVALAPQSADPVALEIILAAEGDKGEVLEAFGLASLAEGKAQTVVEAEPIPDATGDPTQEVEDELQ